LECQTSADKLTGMTAQLPLVERKQRQARQRIIEAARELFLERGFDGVSVGDIAERAEVGRTTFFRHFGDKQEVVFANEQELLDTIAAAKQAASACAPRNATEAVEQLRPILLALCAQATTNPDAYARHFQLIDQHPELVARDGMKMQQIADELNELLIHRGTDEATARFAAQIALACYQTAKYLGNNARTLAKDTDAAFSRALSLRPGYTANQADPPGSEMA
jgi:AcrR family transcriptional regulator